MAPHSSVVALRFCAALIAGMLVLVGGASAAHAQEPGNGRAGDRVTICQATGSATNPYVEITVSESALEAHERHSDDIVPAPPEGCPSGSTEAETATVTADAGAEAEAEAAAGARVAGEGKITICHRTMSATNPYVEITVSVNALSGHNGGHHGDIIPAPAEGCPGPEVAAVAGVMVAPIEEPAAEPAPIAVVDIDMDERGAFLIGPLADEPEPDAAVAGVVDVEADDEVVPAPAEAGSGGLLHGGGASAWPLLALALLALGASAGTLLAVRRTR